MDAHSELSDRLRIYTKQAKPPARQHTGQLLCSGRGIGLDLDPARRGGKKDVSVLMFAGQAQLFLRTGQYILS
jgi:hypothetical protein